MPSAWKNNWSDAWGDAWGDPSLTGVSVCWGHSTGVTETYKRAFVGNWIGTGTIENTGNSERIVLATGQYMNSEILFTDLGVITLSKNKYASGDNVVLKYRTATTEENIALASWVNYSVAFESDGYIQLRLEGI